MSASASAGLNASQQQAVEAVRGPVVILAGAGTGKTTTITRRIANQVLSGAFRPVDVLAVTFTDRAATEMKQRLGALRVGQIRARTFHAEALAQVSHFQGAPELLPSKVQILLPLVKRLPAPYKFRGVKDFAGEIEWAKNRRIGPRDYADAAADRVTPIPGDLMSRVYGEYEARKRRLGRIDFEDLLEEAIRINTERDDVRETVFKRYSTFTVDEYQDVNVLQQTLLDCWLAGRDELCVVGDDYQSIFGFTGASPRYLLDFTKRFPSATVVTLEENHRSTRQVLDIANRLVPKLEGTEKTLRPTKPDGPDAWIGERPDGRDEARSIAEDIRRLQRDGVPLEEIAILYRVNARSEDYEEALSQAGIPFQVRDGSFLRRPGARGVLARLRRADPSAAPSATVEEAARASGWEPEVEADGEEEITRQTDMGRLVRLAAEFEEAGGEAATVAGFAADLSKRFADEDGARGVVLSTYHRAKGLEFEAVFLPRLEEKELPFVLSKGEEEVAEERRLLYVGITRAKRHLGISWAAVRDGKAARPSRFVEELVPRVKASVRPGTSTTVSDPDTFSALRAWRSRTAATAGLPAYVVFHDATLREISERKPGSLVELGRINGVGPAKLAKYGSEVIDVIKAAGAAGVTRTLLD